MVGRAAETNGAERRVPSTTKENERENIEVINSLAISGRRGGEFLARF